MEEENKVKKMIKKKGMEDYNSRVLKNVEKGIKNYEIRIEYVEKGNEKEIKKKDIE